MQPITTLENGRPMSACEIVFNRRSCDTLDGLGLLDSMFLNALKTMLAFAKTFELKYSFRFTEAKIKDIGRVFNASNILLRASLTTCKRHIHAAKTVLQHPAAFPLFQGEVSHILGVLHLEDRSLAIPCDSYMVLLLRAAVNGLTNQ